ncbi:group III truncated hemoglobin [Acidovorax sp.]|uniref:group III truncated hemoglobin n=1 Tax=Acidovorax sp. TaxID=1872122 RepID=UPI00391EE88D
MNARDPAAFHPGPEATTIHLEPSAESMATLVHAFYADVRAHPLLGPVFEAALHGRWDEHLARLVDFWCTVALGQRRFKGGDVFGKHMALSGVTPAHFAAWVGLWQQHTSRLFAPDFAQELQIAAHGIARNLFRGYFGAEPAFAEARERDTAPHG